MRPWSRRARQPCLHPVYGRTPGSSSASSGDPAGENGSPTSPDYYHWGAEPQGALWRMHPVTPKARLLPSY